MGNNYYNMICWDAIKLYINANFLIRRSDLIHYMLHENKNTIDTYRNYLTKAGYLKIVKRGIYNRIKEIPVDLSIIDVKNEAYKPFEFITKEEMTLD